MRNSTIYHNKPKTFRRSSRKMIGGQGGNLQNIEKSIREIYIPDGFKHELEAKCKYWIQCGDLSIFTEEELATLYVFLQNDQSGAEALIVAYDCEAGDYRDLFINKIKPHTYVAMKLFKDVWRDKMKETGGLIEDFDIEAISGTPIPKLKFNPFWKDLDLLIRASDNWSLRERYYYLAKQTVHSANYGIEWATFIMNILSKSGGKIVVTREQGEYFLNTYRSLFPEIPERNRRVARQVKECRLIYNTLGFPYQITEYDPPDHHMKEYYAWGPQSTVGEITRIAITSLQEYIESEHKTWDILADTHDSYLVQCHLGEVNDCRLKMQEFMNIEMVSPIDDVKFRMASECNIGFNWSSYKPKKNELGLQELKWL